MPSHELVDVIAQNKALRRELRLHVQVRKSFAKAFHEDVERRTVEGVLRAGDIRVAHMTSLIMEAHKIALRDEEGATVDVLTDALEHLGRRLEHEVMPRLGGAEIVPGHRSRS